jgi:hypothetical protein
LPTPSKGEFQGKVPVNPGLRQAEHEIIAYVAGFAVLQAMGWLK